MKITILNRVRFLADPHEGKSLLGEVRDMLKGMDSIYPNFEIWMTEKVIPGINDGTRSILVARSNENALAGLAIVKNTNLEKKLCCLRVAKEWHGSGLGVKLFDRAFELLETENPLLSISLDHYKSFSKIFKYYGFEFTKEYNGLYVPQKTEISFNGLLVAEK